MSYTLFAIVLVIWFVVTPHLFPGRPAPPVGVTIGGVLLLIVAYLIDRGLIIFNF